MHTACNIAKSYDYVIEEVKLTPKFRKFALNNVFSTLKHFKFPYLSFCIKLAMKLVATTKKNCCMILFFEQDFRAVVLNLFSTTPSSSNCLVSSQILSSLDDVLKDTYYRNNP